MLNFYRHYKSTQFHHLSFRALVSHLIYFSWTEWYCPCCDKLYSFGVSIETSSGVFWVLIAWISHLDFVTLKQKCCRESGETYEVPSSCGRVHVPRVNHVNALFRFASVDLQNVVCSETGFAGHAYRSDRCSNRHAKRCKRTTAMVSKFN